MKFLNSKSFSSRMDFPWKTHIGNTQVLPGLLCSLSFPPHFLWLLSPGQSKFFTPCKVQASLPLPWGLTGFSQSCAPSSNQLSSPQQGEHPNGPCSVSYFPHVNDISPGRLKPHGGQTIILWSSRSLLPLAPCWAHEDRSTCWWQFREPVNIPLGLTVDPNHRRVHWGQFDEWIWLQKLNIANSFQIMKLILFAMLPQELGAEGMIFHILPHLSFSLDIDTHVDVCVNACIHVRFF